jgi:hypothetical protein
MRRAFLAEGLVMAERFLKPKWESARLDQTVERSRRICSEADYLQAHVTAIGRRPRGEEFTVSGVVHRVMRNFSRRS